MQFYDLTPMARGTHALIYRAQRMNQANPKYYCVKLFKRRCKAFFDLEMAAYERLLHTENIERYIPKVYGYDARTLSGWGLPAVTNDTDLYYAIIMEWVENAEHFSTDNVTVDTASTLLAGLTKIHEAGVLHDDTFPRNILMVPGTRRALWIDFSVSNTSGKNPPWAGEINIAGAMIMYHVLDHNSYANDYSYSRKVDGWDSQRQFLSSLPTLQLSEELPLFHIHPFWHSKGGCGFLGCSALSFDRFTGRRTSRI